MDGQIFFATKGADGKWTKENVPTSPTWTATCPTSSAFAQDNDGEVYALTSVTMGPVGGLDKIYKIVPAS